MGCGRDEPCEQAQGLAGRPWRSTRKRQPRPLSARHREKEALEELRAIPPKASTSSWRRKDSKRLSTAHADRREQPPDFPTNPDNATTAPAGGAANVVEVVEAASALVIAASAIKHWSDPPANTPPTEPPPAPTAEPSEPGRLQSSIGGFGKTDWRNSVAGQSGR